MRNFTRQVFYFLVVVASFTAVTAAQEPVNCKLNYKELRSVKYFVGRYERIPATENESAGLVVDIAIEPDKLNRHHLILLASNLKNRFCKEPRLTVGIFVRKDIAIRFKPEFNEDRDALRGEYVLKRATGEEYISFVKIPDYFGNQQARIKIVLSTENKTKE